MYVMYRSEGQYKSIIPKLKALQFTKRRLLQHTISWPAAEPKAGAELGFLLSKAHMGSYLGEF